MWPTIEQFPQFMAMNLKKVSFGDSAGEDLARRYLIHNIRVEQKHAEHWVEWARVGRPDARRPAATATTSRASQALAHWCWYVCDRASLAVAIAATNYAVEGATGEWSCVVCSQVRPTPQSLPEEIRGPAMRWLRVHAEYDDTHPWEALGHRRHAARPRAAARQRSTRSAARSATSYVYMEMALDHAMLAALHGSFDETASNASTLGRARRRLTWRFARARRRFDDFAYGAARR